VVGRHDPEHISTVDCHCDQCDDDQRLTVGEVTTTTLRQPSVYETSPDDTCSPDHGLLVWTDTQTDIYTDTHTGTPRHTGIHTYMHRYRQWLSRMYCKSDSQI